MELEKSNLSKHDMILEYRFTDNTVSPSGE